MDDLKYIGYKDVSAGAYQVVFPDQRPAGDPSDDFTGDNGDPPDDTKWQIMSGTPEIQSNSLSMAHSSGSDIRDILLSRSVITGTFNVELFTNLTGTTNTSGWYVMLSMLDLDGLNGGRIAMSQGKYLRVYKVTNGTSSQTWESYSGTTPGNYGMKNMARRWYWMGHTKTFISNVV